MHIVSALTPAVNGPLDRPPLALSPALAIPSVVAMANKRFKSKSASNGKGRRNGSAHVVTAALGRQAERRSAASPGEHIRTYSIPDYRLEHPDFTVHQAIEKDKDGAEHVRYEVEGNLDAPVPRIRDSKYL